MPDNGQHWVPTVMLRFVEPVKARIGPVLCQLWVDALGNTEWREVETKYYDDVLNDAASVKLADAPRSYKPCDVFGNEETEDA